MKTFTDLRSTTAKFCNISVADTAKMELVDNNVNDSIRTMCNLQGGKLRFLEATKDMYTVANQEAYQIPNGFRKLIDISVYSGTGSATDTVYAPEMVFDPTTWTRITQFRLGSQDVPYFTYVENTRFLMQPIPQTNGRLIRLRGRLQTRDLTIADYTTGSVVSVPYTATVTGVIASGAVSATLSIAWPLTTGSYFVTFSNGNQRYVTLTASATTATWSSALTSSATASITVGSASGGSIVTGVTGVWTAGMVGRYIQITETTASNGGDGFWYQIGYFYNSTTIGLFKAYEGTAIASATSAYTIGQCSFIPEAYDIGIVYRATALYWQNQGDTVRARAYWGQYDGGNEAGFNNEYGGIIGQMLSNEGETEEGSYVPPFGSQTTGPLAPYYWPFQGASGF